MPNPTPAQVAALAELFGITPETHPHMYRLRQEEYPDGTGYWEEWWSDLPDPLGPDADGVWLAPAVHWGSDMTTPHCYFASVEFAPQMGGGWHCYLDAYGPLPSGNREHEAFGDSMTAAYLQACLAARVPEVCRAMGVEA